MHTGHLQNLRKLQNLWQLRNLLRFASPSSNFTKFIKRVAIKEDRSKVMKIRKITTFKKSVKFRIIHQPIHERESLREFYRGYFCLGNPRLHSMHRSRLHQQFYRATRKSFLSQIFFREKNNVWWIMWKEKMLGNPEFWTVMNFQISIT